MRPSMRRYNRILGAFCVVALLATRTMADGLALWDSTAYVVPTRSVETVLTYPAVPTVYSSSFVYEPTVYVPSLVDYAPLYTTRYDVPLRVSRRRYVNRPIYTTTAAVVPTTLYYPSTFVPTVAWASSATDCPTVCDPCATVASSPVKAASGEAPPINKTRPGTSGENSSSSRVKPPTTLKSEPAIGAEEPAPSAAPTTAAVPDSGTFGGTPPAAPPVDSKVPPFPAAPAPEKAHDESVGEQPEVGATRITPSLNSSPKGDGNDKPKKDTPAPIAPGDGPATSPLEEPVPSNLDAVKREAMKPRLPGTLQPFRRSTARGDLNLLEGKVVASETGLPEPDVRVLARGRQSDAERVSITDANGRYEFRLPDGEWTVSVTMPSGRVYGVSTLNVRNGQIVDDLGRDVPTLKITR